MRASDRLFAKLAGVSAVTTLGITAAMVPITPEAGLITNKYEAAALGIGIAFGGLELTKKVMRSVVGNHQP